MPFEPDKIWQDLKRRRVFKVTAIYAGAAWLVVQVAGEIAPALYLPEWMMTALVVAVIVGFPLVAILAWLFDVGPDGVVRTKPGSATGMTAITVSIGLLVASTAGFVAFVVPVLDAERQSREAMLFEPIEGSIAVLPFLDLSSNQDRGFFADGMAEVIIHQLSQLAELHVIARTSSYRFKDQVVDTREIGRSLNVGQVLAGSVQIQGDRIRISAQLIDTLTGQSLWSELFDRQEEDYFVIQDEISAAVASAMQVDLSDEQRERFRSGLTDDLDAYELYLLGRHDYDSTTAGGAGVVKALDYFERALEIDPDFPLALSGYADALLSHGLVGGIDMDDAFSGAEAAIDRALELDPNLGEAYNSRAIWSQLSGDLDAALTAGERAIELAPSYKTAYHYYGMALGWDGKVTAAMNVLLRGVQLDPRNIMTAQRHMLAGAFAFIGDYDRTMSISVESFHQYLDTPEESAFVEMVSNYALDYGRLDEAVAFANLAIIDGYDYPAIRMHLAFAYLLMGDEVAARQNTAIALRLIDEGKPTSAFEDSQFARFYASVNDVEKLIAETRKLTESAWDSPFPAHDAVLANFYLDRFGQAVDLIESTPDAQKILEARTRTAFAYEKAGEEGTFREKLEEARSVYESEVAEGLDSPYSIRAAAEFHIVDEQHDAAIDALKSLYDSGFRDYEYLRIMPIYDAIRLDPRFIDIVGRMRTDALRMYERVREAEATGDWQSLVHESYPDWRY